MTVEAWAAWAYEYVLPLVGLIVVALLFDIRSKLEAIRLMMVRYFDEKYAPRYDEDGDLTPPG
jgi:hypothetical protein